MDSEHDNLMPAIVGFEVAARLATWPGHRLSSTTMYFSIDIGGGRTVASLVHNVSDADANKLEQQGYAMRTVILGDAPDELGGGLALKRVVVGNTEYHLTSTSS